MKKEIMTNKFYLDEYEISVGVQDITSNKIYWDDNFFVMMKLNNFDNNLVQVDILGGLCTIYEDFNIVIYNPKFEQISLKEIDNYGHIFINIKNSMLNWYYFKKSLINDIYIHNIANITDLVQKYKKMVWEINRDSLTGLVKRERLLDEGEKLLWKSKYGFVAFMDLDHLKDINDNYGHKVGDDYIKCFSNSLEENFGNLPNKIISRLSGDEFAICVGGFNSEEERKKLLSNKYFIGSDFRLPDGSITKIRFTSGIAKYPEDAECINKLLSYTDFTMSMMKKINKGGIKYFNKNEYDSLHNMSKNSSDFFEIIDEQAFEFVYRPYINNKSGKIVIFDMYPMANKEGYEDINKIKFMGKYLYKSIELDEVIYKGMKEELKKLSSISFKQSVTLGYMPQNLFHKGELQRFIEETGFPPERITLCFDSSMRDVYMQVNIINIAKSLGFKFGFKDFGQSALAAPILDVKPNTVKISDSISLGCNSNNEKQEIIKSLVYISKKFGFRTAAGNIDDVKDLECMKKLGINFVGGHSVYRQIKAEDIVNLIGAV